jgi:hypothetical protein
MLATQAGAGFGVFPLSALILAQASLGAVVAEIADGACAYAAPTCRRRGLSRFPMRLHASLRQSATALLQEDEQWPCYTCIMMAQADQNNHQCDLCFDHDGLMPGLAE